MWALLATCRRWGLLRSPFAACRGVNDDVVHISAGKALHAAARRPAQPLWAEGCDHQNVELCPQYLPRLKAFLREVAPAAGQQQ